MPTRRAFLSQLAFAAVPIQPNAQSHTLICIFLRGGADTMNLVVPYADDGYYKARPTLAIRRPGSGTDASLRLDEHYALHPALSPLEAAFKEGRLGMVNAVAVDNTSGSHFECQDQMEHGRAMNGVHAGGGWLGRFLRTRSSHAGGPLSAVAIGTKLPESLRGAPAVSVLEKVQDIAIRSSGDKASPDKVTAALRALYGADVTLLGERGRQTLELFEKITALSADQRAPLHGAEYPKTRFGDGMREVARLVRAGVGLEVACLDLDSWDTHFLQGGASGAHARNAAVLAQSLHALDLDLQDHRKAYTVIVTTEFGRRWYENASAGTDHGRGFAFFALGDQVKGGRVLGPWPLLKEEEVLPIGPGGLKMGYDYRSVFYEVLHRAMGLTDSKQVFPDFEPCHVGLMA
jgi:uncharacterized protein (DUF1501 family)